MVCYLLDGGAVFAELWTLSRGHGYAELLKTLGFVGLFFSAI